MGTALAMVASGAYAQSGTIAKAVGGYTFEDAAKESPDTKNFHSNDGVLTFAIVTHTAGNGFFDPVYVGATVAGFAACRARMAASAAATMMNVDRAVAMNASRVVAGAGRRARQRGQNPDTGVVAYPHAAHVTEDDVTREVATGQPLHSACETTGGRYCRRRRRVAGGVGGSDRPAAALTAKSIRPSKCRAGKFSDVTHEWAYP